MLKELLAARKKVLPFTTATATSTGGEGEVGKAEGELTNLWAIGSGAYGRLGQGKLGNQHTYVKVKYSEPGLHSAVQITSGAGHCLALIVPSRVGTTTAGSSHSEDPPVVSSWG